MKLTVLGGSSANPGTRQGCSSYLVQSDNTRLLLDIGPDTLLELRAHTDYRELDGIVVSHLHADHILDLVALRFALAHNPIPASNLIPLFLPPHGEEMLTRLAHAFESANAGIGWFSEYFDISEYDPEGPIRIGDLTCAFAPTVHYVPCWAIRVHPDDDSGDLLYTADTGPSADLSRIGMGAHVLLAEGTATEDSDEPYEERGHLTPAEAGDLATTLGAHTLVLTHIWEENDPAQSIREATTTFHGSVVRATPGVEVAWRR